VKERLLKKIENFDKNNMEGISFNTLYILEGIYKTKKDFEIIQPKLDRHTGAQKCENYLVFYGDGKVYFYIEDNNENAYNTLMKSEDFDAVLIKNKNKLIIETIQGFKMGGRYGSYKQYIKVIGDKVYIQDGRNCYVYIFAGWSHKNYTDSPNRWG